jgi:cysteine-rich repeat protein
MARITTVIIATLALGLFARTAGAATACAGDCSGDRMVTINELITCVNFALVGTAPSTCPACDPDASGMVAINELIAAVGAALNGCTPTTEGYCGDGMMNVDGEECDDGNTVGGDGCAANCTNEIRRETDLDPEKSISTIQITALSIVLHVTGHQALTGGRPRDTAVFGADGQQLFAPGEIPIVIKTADVQFDPVPIMGLFCACVRGVDVPAFGEGISGKGVLGCGPQGLTDVNFRVEQDHDTTPGSPGNSGSGNGLPDDPECDDHQDTGTGLVSSACLEGVGAMCSGPGSEHVAVPSGPGKRPAACNSPHIYTFSGGQAPRGSVLLLSNTTNGVLANASTTPCQATKKANGECSAPDFGPDCLPCTDDDLNQGEPQISPTTSGSAEVIIYDTADQAGAKLGEGATCGGTPCVGKVTGKLADCDALIADPNAPLTGALVTASSQLDNATSGDLVLTTTLEGKTP